MDRDHGLNLHVACESWTGPWTGLWIVDWTVGLDFTLDGLMLQSPGRRQAVYIILDSSIS